MTEEEAREILRLGDQDGMEAWIAGAIWIPRPKGGEGWRVASTKDGWTFDLVAVDGGVQVTAFPPGPRPRAAMWLMETRRGRSNAPAHQTM